MPFVDDLTIDDEAEIWRRVSLNQIVYDENEARWRPSSAAFHDSGADDPMSALLAEGDTVGRALGGKWVAWFLAALTARAFRARQQGIVRDPTPDDRNHLFIFGKKPSSTRREWARTATWVLGQVLPNAPPR